MSDLLNWFAGNGLYMTLVHCMGGDWPWIAITVLLDIAVASGYVVIAYHWQRNQKTIEDSPARRALANLRNVFVFCGICGYIFIPIKMVWPAWRLYDLFMVVLVYFTWRFAFGARDLRVVYNELGRSQQLQDDLAQSRQETVQRNSFLNAISHDLRTPLNALVLQAEVARVCAETDDRETLLQSIHDMKQSAQVTADLLTDLMELGRLGWTGEPNHISQFCLRDLVQPIFALFQSQAGSKGLYLRYSGSTEIIVASDRTKLERIVVNLVHNAIKFTENGGVEIQVVQSGEEVLLHVCDTGPGIADEHLGQLFDEFYQAHNMERDRRKGFGLGLAIARRLADQLGATIECNSVVGRGSRFTVRFAGDISRTAGDAAAGAGQPA